MNEFLNSFWCSQVPHVFENNIAHVNGIEFSKYHVLLGVKPDLFWSQYGTVQSHLCEDFPSDIFPEQWQEGCW